MRIRLTLLAGVVALAAVWAIGTARMAGAAGPAFDPAVEQALAHIRPDGLRAHTRFLSDDLLEGRGTGTRGHLLAAHYLAAEFKAMGLEPAGVDGTYFQSVPLRHAEAVASQSSLRLRRNGLVREMVSGEDYVLLPDYTRETTSVTAPVVFVGYGITAPELDHDDYAGLKAEGKIVALVRGAPASFPDSQRAHYSSSHTKILNAAAHGAVGLLYLASPQLTPERWKRFVPRLQEGGMSWVDTDGVARPEIPAILHGRAYLGPDGMKTLFDGAPKSMEEVFQALQDGKTPPHFEFPGTVEMHTMSRHRALESPNVVAALRGSDPVLRNEYVVYSAHLDHLGRGRPVDGDDVYNGAMDNALGAASLLVVARGFANLPEPPARSVLFLAVTAEEEGLLGSDYFGHHPTVPADDLVADVNLDCPLLLHTLKDVVAYGAEHSSLNQVVHEAAAEMRLKVSPDPMPEQVFFVRSDQYSFVKQGVPSVFMESGWETGDKKVDAKKLAEAWLRTRYHSPKDDMSQPIDFGAGATLTRLNFLIGYRVASEPARPAWNSGDFFGEHYGHAAGSH
jgi:hypothetical protein